MKHWWSIFTTNWRRKCSALVFWFCALLPRRCWLFLLLVIYLQVIIINRLFSLSIRVFPKLTDLTFLSFLYKIDITGFQNHQKKLPSLGIELTTPTPLVKSQQPYPLSQSASPCLSQTFRPFESHALLNLINWYLANVSIFHLLKHVYWPVTHIGLLVSKQVETTGLLNHWPNAQQ